MSSLNDCSNSSLVTGMLIVLLLVVIWHLCVSYDLIPKNILWATENYGVPIMSCDQKNTIRVDSGLPPLDCIMEHMCSSSCSKIGCGNGHNTPRTPNYMNGPWGVYINTGIKESPGSPPSINYSC